MQDTFSIQSMILLWGLGAYLLEKFENFPSQIEFGSSFKAEKCKTASTLMATCTVINTDK